MRTRVHTLFAYATPERLVTLTAVLFGVGSAMHIYSAGLVKILLDQNAHLNFAREVVDSITPGISQLGFWPPLLHLAMTPFAAIDPLYYSGLAGAFVLIPFLALAGLVLYKLLYLYTDHRGLSVLGSLFFISNPYILYYSSTPMMEVLYFAMLASCAYVYSLWMVNGKLRYLVLAGGLITLASLARFEGFLLIPLCGILTFMRLRQLRKRFEEVESFLILFLLAAVAGLGVVFAYGWVYADTPLAFLSSDWASPVQQRDYFLPAYGNLFESFRYLLYAARYMVGMPQLLLTVLSLGVLITFTRGGYRFLTGALVLIIASPFLFNVISLYTGATVVYVPDLPPHEDFFNERYGLSLILLSSVVPFLAAYAVWFRAYGSGVIARSARALTIAGLTILFFSQGVFFSSTVWGEAYAVIRNSAQEYPNQLQMAQFLRTHYDGGKILITRALHDFTIVNAGIGLKHYIHESNYRYFDQALEQPWLFARWVVMINPEYPVYTSLQRENEAVARRWAGSKEFQTYYLPVAANSGSVLYKVNEEAVQKYAAQSEFSPERIPSLQRDAASWNPETIYQSLAGPNALGTRY